MTPEPHDQVPGARPYDDMTHVMSRFALQLPKKCANKDLSAGSLQERLRSILVFAPTIDVLDALLRPLMDQLDREIPQAATYLRRERYVYPVKPEVLVGWSSPRRGRACEGSCRARIAGPRASRPSTANGRTSSPATVGPARRSARWTSCRTRPQNSEQARSNANNSA